MYFIKQPTGVNGSRLAFLEASLIYLRCYEMRELSLNPLDYRLFHDIGQMRSHNDWSNLIKCTRALGKCLLQWDKSSHSQIIWNSCIVEGFRNLTQYLLTHLLILVENVTIEAVGSESLVEVGLLSCLSDIIQTKDSSCVNLLIDHLIIFLYSHVQIILHMVWSLVDICKVLRYHLLYLRTIFEDFMFSSLIVSFNS